MTIFFEQEVKKQNNGTVFLPDHIWKELGDGILYMGIDVNKKGQKYLAIYMKENGISKTK